jgi:lysophospholipase L1-like esterase
LRPRIILLGDSLTQQGYYDGGWGANIARIYQRHADVILRGYSGYTTRWILPLLEKRLLPGKRPTMIGRSFITCHFLTTDDSI